MTYHLLNSNAFLIAIDLGGLLLFSLVALLKPIEARVRQVENACVRLASYRRVSVLLCFLLVIIGRLALLPIFPVPVPGVHDEFSYLLSGATFASGHLANDTNAMWPFFESFHILQQPHYVSMYPVAPGLFLAIGFALGFPWLGVLLGVALFCAAVTWSLQGWLSPRWALLGGILAVLKYGLASYWIDSYWGGAIPALGGALTFGAVPRILDRRHLGDPLLLAIGLLILANSRPFEGSLFAAAVLGWLIFQMFNRRAQWCVDNLVRRLAPAAIVLILGFALMGVYFRATTGNMLKMPYVRYAEEYSITPAFLWERLHAEPVYRNLQMRQYYERELSEYTRAHTMHGWLTELYGKFSSFSMFYLWPGLFLVILFLPQIIRSREGRVALLAVASVMAGISLEIWPMMLHYPAPATVAALLLVVCALKAARALSFSGWRIGFGIARAVPVLCACALLLRIIAAAKDIPVPEHGLIPYLTIAPGNIERQRIVAQLDKYSGKHLVIVRYGKHHDISHEWVYNSPSIPTSRIVWAREMDQVSTNQLIRYFSGRTVWLVQPDKRPALLKPYSPALPEEDVAPLASR